MHGHSKQFQATNGMNITNNDIFITFEMEDRAAARAVAKKNKKLWQQQQTNKENHSKSSARKERDLNCIW